MKDGLHHGQLSRLALTRKAVLQLQGWRDASCLILAEGPLGGSTEFSQLKSSHLLCALRFSCKRALLLHGQLGLLLKLPLRSISLMSGLQLQQGYVRLLERELDARILTALDLNLKLELLGFDVLLLEIVVKLPLDDAHVWLEVLLVGGRASAAISAPPLKGRMYPFRDVAAPLLLVGRRVTVRISRAHVARHNLIAHRCLKHFSW